MRSVWQFSTSYTIRCASDKLGHPKKKKRKNIGIDPTDAFVECKSMQSSANIWLKAVHWSHAM